MIDLHIPATQSSPEIHTEHAQGRLVLRGDSYPENAYELFNQIFEWIESFLAEQLPRPLQLELHLLYLNTSSIKAMMEIFDLLQEAHDRQHPVSVRWFYDASNERVAELAEEFKEDCSFSFDILATARSAS
ncbi:protein of unknown function [Halopseudomonas litoralis]|uniref:SiaC family regulatory phosphoprotein domain-containing protein n=1 Tax=Halopseudomonas litoralis TaxID=797277 RepID=A0A1H1XKY3_9GAMM|nr:biofilm regulation phosphoprotein SiaC [Halopseudomonas litoralis]SDT09366.1 protein of unknown function [Halopseudomonas litoralis]